MPVVNVHVDSLVIHYYLPYNRCYLCFIIPLSLFNEQERKWLELTIIPFGHMNHTRGEKIAIIPALEWYIQLCDTIEIFAGTGSVDTGGVLPLPDLDISKIEQYTLAPTTSFVFHRRKILNLVMWHSSRVYKPGTMSIADHLKEFKIIRLEEKQRVERVLEEDDEKRDPEDIHPSRRIRSKDD